MAKIANFCPKIAMNFFRPEIFRCEGYSWHIMARANLNKSDKYHHSIKVHTKEDQNQHQLKSPLSEPNLLSKFQKMKNFKNFRINPKNFFALQYIKNWKKVVPWKKNFCSWKKIFVSLKKTTFKILWSEVWKGGFQLILILGLLGMYFDAAVVFVTNS